MAANTKQSIDRFDMDLPDVDDFDLDDNTLIALQKIEEHYLGNPNHYTLFSGGASGSDMYWQNRSSREGIFL